VLKFLQKAALSLREPYYLKAPSAKLSGKDRVNYVCMCMYVRFYVYVCMYVCMYICMSLCVCVCVCVCMYICVYVLVHANMCTFPFFQNCY